MQSIDLKRFRIANNLMQTTVAKYLGVSRGYLSHVETGICDLSHSKLKMLLENDKGWDTSMLLNNTSNIIQSIGDNSSNNTQVAGGEVDSLKEKIAMLEKLLEEKERTIQILMDRR